MQRPLTLPVSLPLLACAPLLLWAELGSAQGIVLRRPPLPPSVPLSSPHLRAAPEGPGSRQLERHLERIRGIHDRMRRFGVPPHLEARFQEHERHLESLLYPRVLVPESYLPGGMIPGGVVPGTREPSGVEPPALESLPAPLEARPPVDRPRGELLPPPVEALPSPQGTIERSREFEIPPPAPGGSSLPPLEAPEPPAGGRDAAVPSPRFTPVAYAKPVEHGGTAEMFPLAPGSEWEYDITYKLIFTPARSGKAVTRIGEAERVEGRTYTRVETAVTGVPGVSEEVKQIRRDAEGNYLVPARDGEEAVLIPARPAVGRKWVVKHESGVDIDFEVMEETKLTTPAGEFEPCYRVKLSAATTFGTAVDEIWFTPGVGIVKETKKRTAFSTTTTLRKFTPATAE